MVVMAFRAGIRGSLVRNAEPQQWVCPAERCRDGTVNFAYRVRLQAARAVRGVLVRHSSTIPSTPTWPPRSLTRVHTAMLVAVPVTAWLQFHGRHLPYHCPTSARVISQHPPTRLKGRHDWPSLPGCGLL